MPEACAVVKVPLPEAGTSAGGVFFAALGLTGSVLCLLQISEPPGQEAKSYAGFFFKKKKKQEKYDGHVDPT
ncbi:hypothetical protein [Streptomyces lunaelactis]|uniref:hypothetical protein n=1 Tax=Streptomyces lunaelactis TaxID=1535768 RepID=UPI0020C7BAC6|nr:hypothetical protein [Streptomyces lunaelactis]